jgi:ABC-type Zn2+ transport system substrate-binding protein/surface adhesin
MIRDLHTVAQFASKTSFTEPQLRWWIFNAAANGLEAHKAVIRVGGRRVYIDADAFNRWIDSQNSSGAAA